MKLAEEYLKISSDDLVVSEILFRESKYSYSIYFLQQSVEKASKAFGLYSESISTDELKTKISHNSKKVFTRGIDSLQKEFNKISDIELLFGEFLNLDEPESKLEFSDFWTKMQKEFKSLVHLNPNDFTWLEEEEFNEIIQVIEGASFSDHILDEIKDGIKLNLGRVLESLSKSEIYEIKQTENELTSIVSKFASLFVDLQPKLTKVYLSLFYLSLILTAHNQITRYPCDSCGETPMDIYDDDELLIKKYAILKKLIQENIETIKEVFLDLKPAGNNS